MAVVAIKGEKAGVLRIRRFREGASIRGHARVRAHLRIGSVRVHELQLELMPCTITFAVRTGIITIMTILMVTGTATAWVDIRMFRCPPRE
jgi:alpha-D-ribose 1-methylphosphonate 5-triphosphate synthase subunit PhnI